MKRTALTLILALLFSSVAGTTIVNLAAANPAPLFYPREPNISIESPTNRTYNVTSLPLNVTIKTFNSYQEEYNTNTHRLVSYSLDGESSQFIDDTFQKEVPPGYIVGEYTIFAASVFLSGLKEGSHNLTVRAQYDYTTTYDSSHWHFESESSVFFSIDISEPFPIALVITASGVSIAVIGLGLLVYFKKRKRQTQ